MYNSETSCGGRRVRSTTAWAMWGLDMAADPEPAKMPLRDGLGKKGVRKGGHGAMVEECDVADAMRVLLPVRGRRTMVAGEGW